ncbi:hypothetical protein D5018_19125 [Parashewanella curva]|uniref:IS66 family insertion sequence element accessory protein TnpB n=1 Tax=Parashewanella curva TaxID=2338552 RepID=A0A3L8PRT5_9GAMM|nr:hypothetical protein [Parashewanella curva]RLV58086.1 hypothetical protein D5018_19125 [Parashewanella curva]
MLDISRKLEEWERIIQIQQGFGLSIKRFCQRHTLSEQSFHKAKARLKSKVQLAQEIPSNTHAQIFQSEFIVIQSNVSSSSEPTIELTLSTLKLTIPASISPQWLACFIKEVNQ